MPTVSENKSQPMQTLADCGKEKVKNFAVA
jgi:hypothetical protein